MENRRLSLRRETLTALDSGELSAVAGAISTTHPLCLIGTTSRQYSQCPSCGIACTYNCPTRECPTDAC